MNRGRAGRRSQVMGITVAEDSTRDNVAAPLPGHDRTRERSLLKRAKRGDRDAIDELVGSHWDNAYRAALLISRDHQAAEDIAQESFLAALGSLRRFDRRRPFRPWLHRIVTNKAIDHHRSLARRAETLTEMPSPPVSARSDEGIAAELVEALDRLDAEDRAIVVLRHLLDYRSEEIGSILNLPAGTVRGRLSRALSTMRVELEEEL